MIPNEMIANHQHPGKTFSHLLTDAVKTGEMASRDMVEAYKMQNLYN